MARQAQAGIRDGVPMKHSKKNGQKNNKKSGRGLNFGQLVGKKVGALINLGATTAQIMQFIEKSQEYVVRERMLSNMKAELDHDYNGLRKTLTGRTYAYPEEGIDWD